MIGLFEGRGSMIHAAYWPGADHLAIKDSRGEEVRIAGSELAILVSVVEEAISRRNSFLFDRRGVHLDDERHRAPPFPRGRV